MCKKYLSDFLGVGLTEVTQLCSADNLLQYFSSESSEYEIISIWASMCVLVFFLSSTEFAH